MGRLILVGGGARSGKSRFAQGYAERLGRSRGFVATAQAFDDEMTARIARHQADRGDAFVTVEEPLDLGGALARMVDRDVVLVDCLTLWISNLLLQGESDEAIDQQLGAVLGTMRALPASVIMVTNEVGLGLVPETSLGRRFRDLAGTAHQRIARSADEIYFAALGMMMRLLPAPLIAFLPGEPPCPT